MPNYRVWPKLEVAQDADHYRVPYVGREFGDYYMVYADSEEEALAIVNRQIDHEPI